MHHFIHVVTTLSACDYTMRSKFYKELICFLFSNPRQNLVSSYIANAMIEDFTKLDDVMPFIEHFIRCCNEEYVIDMKKYMKQLGQEKVFEKQFNVMKKCMKQLGHGKVFEKQLIPNFNCKNQRKQMITYRNSLLIMKHFSKI